MLLPITLTLAAACALLNLWLALRCSQLRIAGKVLHGDGGDPRLVRRMRAHANFIEYTPIALILFALIELALGAALWLWIVALVYIVSRVAHTLGMDMDRPNAARAAGITATWVVLLVLAIAALYAAYSGTRDVPAPAALAAQV
ncbi:MAPEG family protein [Sphingobium sp. AN641]|uniref:MAPEG family protein n=1 Tax=Sphingobium sp. AN641 TaxID=3133443 RepID=UPI0030C27222